MKAAERFKQRPSVMILGKDSKRSAWSRTDIVLARAYERYLAELCQQCGLPRYICHNDDESIQFKVSIDECGSRARAERVQADDQEKAQKAKTGLYGKRYYGEPHLTQQALDEGKELSDFRTPYYKMEAAKRSPTASTPT